MKCDKHTMLLYAVTDRAWVGEQTLYQQVESALKGGATCVQLREKQLGDADFLQEAIQIHALCQQYGVPLFINDNVEVALQCHAEGIHVGQDDMAALDARAKLGPDKLIGVSAHTVEEALLGEKIPYTIYSGVQFFDRMEIKDALSYLRMIAYKDDLSFRRIVNVPKRNLGKRRMAFLQEYAERQGRSLYQALQDNLEDPLFKGTGAGRFVGLIESFAAGYGGRPVSGVLSALLNESGYEKMLRTEGSQERLDNLAELKQSVYEYETTCGEEVTLEHYLAHVALFTNADTAEQGDKVRLMTVHAAKGLEFPYVFLCGMNEGIFPSRKVRTQQAMEEERRLAFVALTRAEKGLYLSEADGRNFDGTPRYPSRFLLDIDRNLLAFTRPPEEGLIRAARDYIGHSQTYLPETDGNMAFSVGQRVKHILFGSGTVLDVDMDKGAHVVQFDEMETPRKISFRAKLERI